MSVSSADKSWKVSFSPQVEPRPRVWPPRQGIDLTEVRHELLLYGEVIAVVCLLMAFANLALYPWVVKGHRSVIFHYEHILKMEGSRIEELIDLIHNIDHLPYENMTAEDMVHSIFHTTPCGISNRFPHVPNDTENKCRMTKNWFHGYIKMSNFEEYENISDYISSRALQHYHKYHCCFFERLPRCPCGYVAANETICLGIPINDTLNQNQRMIQTSSELEDDPDFLAASDDDPYCNGKGTYRNIQSETPECLEYKDLFKKFGIAAKDTAYCSFEIDNNASIPFIQGVCVYEKSDHLMTWMF